MTYSIALNFADSIVPTIVGTQLVLPQAPAPPESLQVFRNGVLQQRGPDYVASGNFIVTASAIDPNDAWLCFYRY